MAQVTYTKQYPLGFDTRETISITLDSTGDEAPLQTFGRAKRFVEKSHNYFAQLPRYNQSKLIVANSEQYAPAVVAEAQAFIADFETEYSDFITEFPPEDYTEVTSA